MMFLWNDRAAEKLNTDYTPNSNYISTSSNVTPTLGVRRTATGKYTVFFGLPHDPLNFPVISQVVAYGTDSTHCKFDTASQPIQCLPGMPGIVGACTAVFVACYTPQGAAANSMFAIQITARDAYKDTVGGDGGFYESADLATTVQMAWTQLSNGEIRRSTSIPAAGSSMKTNPSFSRTGVGAYQVDFPGLADKPLGIAQVTAIGGDTVRCKIPKAPAAASSGSHTLRIWIRCWVQNGSADTDFVLNYDSSLQRRLELHSTMDDFEAAHGYAYDATASYYTPSRSMNSGSNPTQPPTLMNQAQKGLTTGTYRMLHEDLSPTNSSAYVVAVGSDSRYCKLESWLPVYQQTTVWGTQVVIRCFDYNGNPADSKYQESYQGPQQPPG
jgi:hypothetical protein